MSVFIKTALKPAVLSTALRISLLVGTLLALINHSPAIFSLTVSPQNFVQIVLTYLVPYGVSTYSSVKAIVSLQDPSS
jgi:hypothetical protein